MRRNEVATTILFLRHGATDFPENRYYCDSIEDPPLNSMGLKQAGVWGEALKGRSIVAIYASPSRRTLETAQLAAKRLGLPAQTLDGLRERSFGVWDGLTSEEIEKKFPAEWSAWKKEMIHVAPFGGESLLSFSKRVDETIQLLLSRHTGKTILVVTHAGPIRVIVAAALGMPLDNVKRLVVGSCSTTEIDYTASWPNLVSFSLGPEFFYKENR